MNTSQQEALLPCVGSLALCSMGYLGLIQGRNEKHWYGVSLSESGKKWTSRNPKVLGHISNGQPAPVISEDEAVRLMWSATYTCEQIMPDFVPDLMRAAYRALLAAQQPKPEGV